MTPVHRKRPVVEWSEVTDHRHECDSMHEAAAIAAQAAIDRKFTTVTIDRGDGVTLSIRRET